MEVRERAGIDACHGHWAPPTSKAEAVRHYAQNQKCLYEKADLLAWVRANKVSSTVEAAVRKASVSRLSPTLRVEAFWLDVHGQVIGMVEAALMETVIECLGMYEIAWLPAVNAGARTWNDFASHQLLAEAVSNLLRRELSRVEARIDQLSSRPDPRQPRREALGASYEQSP